MLTRVSTRTRSRDASNHRRVDGSPQSRRALQWALSEAAARHAPLTVLSSQSGPAPPVTVQVIPGSPAAELLGAGQHADLLVVGSRGSGGLGRRGVGSVSDQVASDAACPVVIIFQP